MHDYLIFGIVVLAVALLLVGVFFLKDKKIEQQETSVRRECSKGEGKAQKHLFFKRVPKSVLEQIQIRYYDEAEGFYVLKDGSNLDLLQIQSKDLISASEDEVEYDCLKFAKLYKIYGEDIKMIALNFPCNTTRQQQYFKRKQKQAKNEIYRQWLQKKLQELEILEKNDTTREFYLMIFSRNADDHTKHLSTLSNILAAGRDGLISQLSARKKHQILFKLNNKNSLVS